MSLRENIRSLNKWQRIIPTIIIFGFGTYFSIVFATDNFGQHVISSSELPIFLRLSVTIFMSICTIGLSLACAFIVPKK